MFKVLWVCLKFILLLRFPRNHSIADIIKRRYGETTLHTFRAAEKAQFKLLKAQCDVDFLNACLNHGLLPKFVRFKVYDPNLQDSRLYRNCQRRFLHNELRTKNRSVKVCSTKLDTLWLTLKGQVSFLDFNHLRNFILTSTQKTINRVKFAQHRKLKGLGLPDSSALSPDSVIFNLSDRILSIHEKEVLSLGLKFAITLKKPNFYDHFLSCEQFFKKLDGTDITCPPGQSPSLFKHSFRHLCLSLFYSFKSPQSSNLSSAQWQALQDLKKDKSILISKPDKGNGVVILNRSDYIHKMHDILKDSSKFSRCDKDIFLSLLHNEDKLNRLLRALKSKGAINESSYFELFSSGSRPGVLYGLPKVHKSGTPLRPILSAIGTFNYSLAKFLVTLINPVIPNEYIVQDTFSFVKEISNMNASGCVMASFDIVSLFNNIPLDESIDICTNLVSEEGSLPSKLTTLDFKSLLSIALKNTIFLFNDVYYHQIDGVPMGSPLGPSMANSFLSFHEKQWLDNCPLSFKPVLYRRYVDDTFVLFKSAEHIPMFLDYLNNQHRCIKFTHESEHNSCISFLDIEIKRSESSFDTSVYRKPTFTGLTMKFSSFLPSYFKSNLIETLAYRAYRISSSFVSLDKEFKFLTKLFTSNGFPLQLVEKCIGKALNRLHASSHEIIQHPKQGEDRTVFKIPFYGPSSFAFKNKIQHLLKQFYPDRKFRLVFTSCLRISDFFQFKDRIPAALQSSIVYQYICEDCQASYVGKTCRQLKVRSAEHQGVSPRTGGSVGSPLHSAIRDHCSSSGHHFKTSSFKILKSSSPSALFILESLFIHNLEPSLSPEKSVELLCF